MIIRHDHSNKALSEIHKCQIVDNVYENFNCFLEYQFFEKNLFELSDLPFYQIFNFQILAISFVLMIIELCDNRILSHFLMIYPFLFIKK